MKRLNLLLILTLFCGGLIVPERTWAADPTQVKAAQGEAVAAVLPSLPYTYPLANFNWDEKFPGQPIVVELFTSLDCMFCPRAEHLLADMIDKAPSVVALACHTDPQGPSYPAALDACTTRQERYAGQLADGLLYTPQMVINGRLDAVGYDFEDVVAKLSAASGGEPIMRLNPQFTQERGIYRLDLPETDLSKTGPADILLLVYRAPYKVPETQRQSRTRPDPLLHVVSRIVTLSGWDGKEKTLTFAPTLEQSEGGFAILVQTEKGKIIGAFDTQSLKR